VTHIKNSQFSTLAAAHRAKVRGPPVGRGPQVENRSPSVYKCQLFYYRISISSD